MKVLLLLLILPCLVLGEVCPGGTLTCPEGKSCCKVNGEQSCCGSDERSVLKAEEPIMLPGSYLNTSIKEAQAQGRDGNSWLEKMFCSGTMCPSGCCESFQNAVCCDPICCKTGSSCCGKEACCPSGSYCTGKHCCATGTEGCGTGCCPSGSYCIGNENCCPTGSEGCGTFCCSSGSYCTGNNCCPTGSVGCGTGCCPSGYYCTGKICCPEGSRACGSWCCANSLRCGENPDTCGSGSVVTPTAIVFLAIAAVLLSLKSLLL